MKVEALVVIRLAVVAMSTLAVSLSDELLLPRKIIPPPPRTSLAKFEEETVTSPDVPIVPAPERL